MKAAGEEAQSIKYVRPVRSIPACSIAVCVDDGSQKQAIYRGHVSHLPCGLSVLLEVIYELLIVHAIITLRPSSLSYPEARWCG